MQSFGAEQQWRSETQGLIRPGVGANGFVEGRRSFGARSRGLGCGESSGVVRMRPERRRLARAQLRCVLRTGEERGTGRRKWTWRSTQQRGRLSGDVLAGVTRGDADVEIGGALEAQLTKIE